MDFNKCGVFSCVYVSSEMGGAMGWLAVRYSTKRKRANNVKSLCLTNINGYICRKEDETSVLSLQIKQHEKANQ